MSSIGLVGRKCGMTRIFTEAGASIPVTVIQFEENYVTQIKTKENDGYCALQLGTDKRRHSLISKPMAGHLAKAGVEGVRVIQEFRMPSTEALGEFTLGYKFNVSLFEVGQKVDVQGVTKGKGFAGTIKRHHFHSQDASHGNSLSHRVMGSTGMNQSPGRVFPGKKMPGQLGNVNRTAQNQEIVRIDIERGLIFIRGCIPGSTNGLVTVFSTVKRGN